MNYIFNSFEQLIPFFILFLNPFFHSASLSTFPLLNRLFIPSHTCFYFHTGSAVSLNPLKFYFHNCLLKMFNKHYPSISRYFVHLIPHISYVVCYCFFESLPWFPFIPSLRPLISFHKYTSTSLHTNSQGGLVVSCFTLYNLNFTETLVNFKSIYILRLINFKSLLII